MTTSKKYSPEARERAVQVTGLIRLEFPRADQGLQPEEDVSWTIEQAAGFCRGPLPPY